MVNTEALNKADTVIRVRCSPEAYKQFKLAAVQADMSKKAALDAAFKLFAMAIKAEIDKGTSDGDSA